jgi:hypothetical protein
MHFDVLSEDILIVMVVRRAACCAGAAWCRMPRLRARANPVSLEPAGRIPGGTFLLLPLLARSLRHVDHDRGPS